MLLGTNTLIAHSLEMIIVTVGKQRIYVMLLLCAMQETRVITTQKSLLLDMVRKDSQTFLAGDEREKKVNASPRKLYNLKKQHAVGSTFSSTVYLIALLLPEIIMVALQEMLHTEIMLNVKISRQQATKWPEILILITPSNQTHSSKTQVLHFIILKKFSNCSTADEPVPQQKIH